MLWGSARRGARQLEDLIEQLPPDSATARALDPEITGVGWTQQIEMLATIAELIDANTRLHFEVNKGKGQTSPPPIRILRPWQPRRQRRQATLAETRAMFGGAPVIGAPKHRKE